MQRHGMSLALTLGLFTSTACGGGSAVTSQPFSTDWSNDNGASISRVQKQLAGASVSPGAAVAVGITPQGLVGVGLDGSGAWKHDGEVEARPAIAGGVVVVTGKSQLYALDAKSGKKLWSVPSEGKLLRGAGDDGTHTIVSLGTREGGGGTLVALDRSGKAVLEMEAEPEIGTPAVLGGVGFVPWGNQYVSAIDLDDGGEIGRLLMREQVSHAFASGGSLWFGERKVVRFDASVGQAAAGGGSALGVPERELPGKPEWLGSGSQVTQRPASARDKIRLYARPGESSFDSERVAATYFKVALGMHGEDGSLRWVRMFPQAILGGDAAQGGFAFCDAQGKVWIVNAKGGMDAGSADLKTPVQACIVQGGGFKVTGGGANTTPLPSQVATAIAKKEPQMVTAQRFLLRELAVMQGAEVTKALIDLSSDPATPPMLLEDAGKLLASRRDGADHMMAALERRYDYLADITLPPPVGPLADALAAVDESGAASLLAEHLNDPATSLKDLARVAKALAKLATADELPALHDFFTVYRATAEDDAMINAVIEVARAIVRVGDDEDKDILRAAADDDMTQESVKNALVSLVPPAAAKKTSGDKK